MKSYSQAIFLVTLSLMFIGCNSGVAGGNAANAPKPPDTPNSAENKPAQPPSTPPPPPVKAESNILFILDSSGSMKARAGSKTKMEAAKEVLNNLVGTLPAESQVGLLAYGHRAKNDCQDTELLVPFGRLEADLFKQKVESLQPLGQTPISYSLRQAAAVLKGKSGNKTVILVSDGEETCKEDPCAVAAELKKAEIDLKVHVIGFGIDTAAAKKQLTCIAQSTGGTYQDAGNAEELKKTLEGVTGPDDSTNNLIKNGSFEIGPDPGSFTSYNEGATDISNWRVTTRQIDYIEKIWNASEGKRSLDLDGTPGAGGVSQSFATIPGQEYLLTFDLAGNPEGPPSIKKVQVNAAGQSALFSFDVSGKSSSNMGWEKKTWRFKAQDKTTTLELISLGEAEGKFGPVIDNVSVVAAIK